MAAPRHARKPAFRRAGGGAALVALIFASPVPMGAQTTEYIVVDRNTGLAIHGFDPLAYFTDGAASVGRGEFEYRHAGVVWRFRNAGNLAAFVADPDVYMPRFGGYDPMGVGRGVAAAGDPRLFMIAGERLYLFHSPESKAAFVAGGARAVTAADEAWASVQRTLSP